MESRKLEYRDYWIGSINSTKAQVVSTCVGVRAGPRRMAHPRSTSMLPICEVRPDYRGKPSCFALDRGIVLFNQSKVVG